MVDLTGSTLTRQDRAELNCGRSRVASLMRDGEWHTAAAIRLAAGENGIPASEGLRRLRELKAEYASQGLVVEKRRSQQAGRHFEYRVTRSKEALRAVPQEDVIKQQGTLFPGG